MLQTCVRNKVSEGLQSLLSARVKTGKLRSCRVALRAHALEYEFQLCHSWYGSKKKRKGRWEGGKERKEKREEGRQASLLAGQLPRCLPSTRYCPLTLGLFSTNADTVYQQAMRRTQALEPFGQLWTGFLLENYGGTKSSF